MYPASLAAVSRLSYTEADAALAAPQVSRQQGWWVGGGLGGGG